MARIRSSVSFLVWWKVFWHFYSTGVFWILMVDWEANYFFNMFWMVFDAFFFVQLNSSWVNLPGILFGNFRNFFWSCVSRLSIFLGVIRLVCRKSQRWYRNNAQMEYVKTDLLTQKVDDLNALLSWVGFLWIFACRGLEFR